MIVARTFDSSNPRRRPFTAPHAKMQSTAASRRLLSTISSKLHPQLPLSSRESQQLLNLLTTSFRAHLDREHPLPAAEATQNRLTRRSSTSNAQRIASPAMAPSSYTSATRHIDSILTNPLFAVKPQRRSSETAAVDVLRDPMVWFVNEIATGAANLSKASMCLEVLEKTTVDRLRTRNGQSAARVIAAWLQNSGLDTSKQFLELCMSKHGHGSRFLHRLTTLLLAEGETTSPWRWFIRSNEQRVKDTGLDTSKVAIFRQQLLAKMVSIDANVGTTRGLATFMQAFRMMENIGHDSAYAVLRPAGAHLVNRITSNTADTIEPGLYQPFMLSTERWLGNWSRAVDSMLSLYHPTEPSVQPALRFIQDPTGAATFVQSSRSRRQFLVQLCLGVARQSLEREKYTDAQLAMEFTKDYFADIVLSRIPVAEKQSTSQWRVRRERENLNLLDSLVPT